MSRSDDTACINLRKRFGNEFRITYDAVIDPRGKHREKIDPWLQEIRGRYGTIYAFGAERLAVDIDGHPIVAKRVAAFDFVELVQNGDREKTFAFHIDDFPAIAEIVRPHRKQRLTEEQKREATERLAQYRFRSRGSEQTLEPQTPAEDVA